LVPKSIVTVRPGEPLGFYLSAKFDEIEVMSLTWDIVNQGLLLANFCQELSERYHYVEATYKSVSTLLGREYKLFTTSERLSLIKSGRSVSAPFESELFEEISDKLSYEESFATEYGLDQSRLRLRQTIRNYILRNPIKFGFIKTVYFTYFPKLISNNGFEYYVFDDAQDVEEVIDHKNIYEIIRDGEFNAILLNAYHNRTAVRFDLWFRYNITEFSRYPTFPHTLPITFTGKTTYKRNVIDFYYQIPEKFEFLLELEPHLPSVPNLVFAEKDIPVSFIDDTRIFNIFMKRMSVFNDHIKVIDETQFFSPSMFESLSYE
jgi:hypothetical protein